MKKMLISTVTILLLLAFCINSTYRVEKVCEETSGLLRKAETQCLLGDYQGAEDIIRLSQTLWQRNEGFLGIVLRHTESDNVDILFPSLLETCNQKNPSEFMLRNMELLATLRQLSRMEYPYIFNIL